MSETGKKTKGNQPSESAGLDCKPIGELMTDEQFMQKLGQDIYHAVIQGNTYNLRVYITASKENENFKEIIQYLPLLAASKNQIDILRNFVPISCITSLDSRKRTPLHYAAYNCHVEAVKFLLHETLLDHMLEDDLGYSAFQYSCVGGDTDIMDLILDKTEVNTDLDNNREDISKPDFGLIQQESVPTFGRMMAPAMPSMAPPMMAPMAKMATPMMAPMAPPMMAPMAEMAFQMPEMAPAMMAPEMAAPPPAAEIMRSAPMRNMKRASPANMGHTIDGPFMMDSQMTPQFNAMTAPVQIMESMPPMQRMRGLSREIGGQDAAAQTFAKSNKAMRMNTRDVADKKKENLPPKKFFLQSLILAARRGNTKAVLRLLDDETLGEEAQAGLGSGRNSLLHFLGRRISAQELGKLAECGLDITSRNTDGVRAFEEVPPPVLEEFLDISVSAASENINEHVTESYTIKNPFLNKDHTNLDVTTLLEISNSLIHTKLIFHPVFYGICAIKWRYIRKYYWFLVLMAFLFAFITSLVTVMKVKDSYQINNKNESKVWLVEDSKINVFICQILTCCLLLLLVVTEISNMLFHTLYLYIIRYLVISSCIIFELILIFLFPVGILQENAYFVIFIPWLFVMYRICQHYSFAQYYSNFVQIAKTTLKLMFVFGSLPIAFSLVFHIMMMKEKSVGGEISISAYDYFHSSSIKTIAMMMGDFSIEEFSNQYTNLQWSVTYTFFILCVSLVLYNMINALAVSDTQKLNERAEVFRMIALTRQILSLQKWIRFLTKLPGFHSLYIPVIKDFTVSCKNYRWNIEKYTYESKEGSDTEIQEDIEIRSGEDVDVNPKYSLKSRCKYISVQCTSKFVDDLKLIVQRRIPSSF